jgi:hypothetical protein
MIPPLRFPGCAFFVQSSPDFNMAGAGMAKTTAAIMLTPFLDSFSRR